MLLLSPAVFASGGTLSGTVEFTGKVPALKALDRSSDPVCSVKTFNDEAVVVGSGAGKNGKGLENVVIRLDDVAPGAPGPKTPVSVAQSECMYRPRVQVAREGQGIEVKNTDPTLHNVHAYAGKKGLFNVAQPPSAPTIAKMPPAGTDVVRLKCDVHPWMTGWVVYAKNPYFAVSRPDGTFSIAGVPPGKYTVRAWHESLGTQAQSVTVAEGETARMTFTFHP